MIRKKKKKSGNSVPLHREQRCELLVSMMVANVYLLPRPCPWESWVEPAGTSLEGSKSAEVESTVGCLDKSQHSRPEKAVPRKACSQSWPLAGKQLPTPL